MPCLRIVTNVSKSKIPVDFVDKVIPVLAKCLNKEPKRFVCTISGDTPVSMGGESRSPGAVATLESIGGVGPQENHLIISTLSDFVEKELGVSPDRFFVSIYDLKPSNIGKNGTTAENLTKS